MGAHGAGGVPAAQPERTLLLCRPVGLCLRDATHEHRPTGGRWVGNIHGAVRPVKGLQGLQLIPVDRMAKLPALFIIDHEHCSKSALGTGR